MSFLQQFNFNQSHYSQNLLLSNNKKTINRHFFFFQYFNPKINLFQTKTNQLINHNTTNIIQKSLSLLKKKKKSKCSSKSSPFTHSSSVIYYDGLSTTISTIKQQIAMFLNNLTNWNFACQQILTPFHNHIFSTKTKTNNKHTTHSSSRLLDYPFTASCLFCLHLPLSHFPPNLINQATLLCST